MKILHLLLLLGIVFCDEKDELKIQPFSFPNQPIAGQRVSVMCATTWGQQLQFQWFKNNVELTSSERIQIASLSFASNMAIDSLTEDDDGNYTCKVTSGILTDSFSTALSVLVPPSWKNMPVDKEVHLGQTVILLCYATGKPVPLVTWTKSSRREDSFVILHDTDTLTIYQNGSLVIENVMKKDEGFYTCKISNGVGKDIEKTVSVTIYGKK
ncbi:Down syndrome cell adhesion molecule homolog [Centruroides sculpturatus]|uniref:Down syndrome cell adhesion molecule homolog n=1 Tax=Centruroides sculpturatus TaxID=218467 RepID=UPI000C6EAC06|nr:Down syndrome cell adhesion molecule homolog [Centruroides sculpturatus]